MMKKRPFSLSIFYVLPLSLFANRLVLIGLPSSDLVGSTPELLEIAGDPSRLNDQNILRHFAISKLILIFLINHKF